MFQSIRSFSRGGEIKKNVALSIFNDANSRDLGALREAKRVKSEVAQKENTEFRSSSFSKKNFLDRTAGKLRRAVIAGR